MDRSVSSRKPARTSIVKNKHQDILATIGNTPVVRINKLAPDHVNLFVKLESFNPAGSVKDRLALGIIEDAEASGDLQPGQTVVEATSGNTGIGLAMVCAQKGYPLVIVMAESFSVERRKISSYPRPLEGKRYGRKGERTRRNSWLVFDSSV
jgi:cysteine synthase A